MTWQTPTKKKRCLVVDSLPANTDPKNLVLADDVANTDLKKTVLAYDVAYTKFFIAFPESKSNVSDSSDDIHDCHMLFLLRTRISSWFWLVSGFALCFAGSTLSVPPGSSLFSLRFFSSGVGALHGFLRIGPIDTIGNFLLLVRTIKNFLLHFPVSMYAIERLDGIHWSH
jgi:hypothetical protein